MTFRSEIKKFLRHLLALARHRSTINKKVRGRGNKVQIESLCAGTILDIAGDGNSVRILRGGYIEGLKIFIRGSNISVAVGEDVSFFRGGASLWLEDDNSSIVIGNNSAFHGDVHIASTEGAKIAIGSGCLIAPGVQIRSGDSHAIYHESARINLAKPVLVSDRVWIGDGAVILKGAIVPPDSVVATRAVVTKSFAEPGSVLAGNPARQVKTGITWSADRNPSCS